MMPILCKILSKYVKVDLHIYLRMLVFSDATPRTIVQPSINRSWVLIILSADGVLHKFQIIDLKYLAILSHNVNWLGENPAITKP
jgi:hypothetical protein